MYFISVQTVDASVQSDTEEPQENVRPKPILRKTSTLQVVVEQDVDTEEDNDMDWVSMALFVINP
jgi:hypothetical protein